MKNVLFIRGPRYLLSTIPEYTNFQLPLGMCSIATVLHNSLPELTVEIIDCPAEKIGWRSLIKILEEKKPDIVAAGEPQSFYYHETVKVFEITKSISPETITIAGGLFFSAMPEFVLKNFKDIDYIIKGEAEITFSELIKAIIEEDVGKVKGIAFRKDGDFVHTPLRPPVANLDDLPIPRYEMLPMGNYFWPKAAYFDKNLLSSALIETSRGCPFQCDFCSLWYFWGTKDKPEKVQPFYRRKSVGRVIKEIEILYKKYGKRFLVFVDAFFNNSQEWSDEFCEKLLEKDYKDLKWFGYLRPDFAIRDERKGILKKMIRAGFSWTQIGGERTPHSSLKYKGKTIPAAKIVSILREKYPQVIVGFTILIGMPGDSYKEVINQSLYALELSLSYILCIFPIPFPGTVLYDDYIKRGKLNNRDFLQTNYGLQHLSHKLPYKTSHIPKKLPLAFIVWINPQLLYLLLTLNNSKYKNIASFFSKIIYKNSFTLIFANIIFFLLITPVSFFVFRNRSFYQWRKPLWYNS